MGRPFMPHQRAIADVFLEVQSEEAGDPAPGEWAYDDGTATLERRGGKTSLIVPIAAHRAHRIKRARIFLTAQTRDKARSRWLDATDDILHSPLRDEIRRKIGNMNELCTWPKSGSTFGIFAPNDDGLHSETPDLVFIDEVWAFTAEQAKAIKAGYVPAFATSSGQALKLSTSGTDASAWLNQLRRTGRKAVEAGRRRGVFYYEHSLPNRWNGKRIAALTDDELIEACIANHPAICHAPECPGPRLKRPCPHGFTVRPAALWSAWTELDDRGEFLRAYGNRPTADDAERWQAIEEAVWLERLDPTPFPDSARVSFGVWVDEDGEDAAVSAGWRGPDGSMLVEVVKRASGVRWVAPYVASVVERARKGPGVGSVAIPNVGASRDVADALAQLLDVELLRVSQADVAAACHRHRTELIDGSWRHRISTDATKAAAAAGWARDRWERLGDPISALGSETMAGWAHDHAPAPEPRRGPFKIR